MNHFTIDKRPCPSCPYVKATPPGVWHESEYRKLPDYDKPTGEQPVGVFMCHNGGEKKSNNCLCRGWADVHDPHHLLSLRFAQMGGIHVPEEVFTPSGVEVYASGQEACDAGIRKKAEGKALVMANHLMEKHDHLREAGEEDEIGCVSCGEQMMRNECPNSKRECGHHCNCSWSQDKCCWCGMEWSDEEEDYTAHYWVYSAERGRMVLCASEGRTMNEFLRFWREERNTIYYHMT